MSDIELKRAVGAYTVGEAPRQERSGSALPEGQFFAAVIPAYNEERFIGSVVLKVGRYVHSVIVVDDGSSDDTAALAEAAGAMVLQHEQNQGKGQALNTGFVQARELNPDVIVIIDGDGQHLPEQLPRIVQPILDGQADIVIGSRYLRSGSQVPRHRVLGHRFFNLLTNRTSGVAVTDSQSGFRAFSRRAYQTSSFQCSDFSVESEMQFLARENGLQVVEVPITIRYPDKPKRNVIQHGLWVLNGVLRLAGQYRPLLFIGLPGALVLLGGIGMGIWVVAIFNRIHVLAVGYAMISVLLSIVGLVMLSTGVILHSVRGLLLDMLKPHLERERQRGV